MVDLFNSENIFMGELNDQTIYGNILEQMFSVFTRKIIEEDVWSLSDLSRICFFIRKLGFSPYHCMLEKLKELNSKDDYKAEYREKE